MDKPGCLMCRIRVTCVQEGLRFVKGGTISTSAGLQPTPGKDRAPLLRHTDQGSPKKASQILVMRHAGELSGSRGIPDIGEGVGFEGGDGSGGGSATPGADSASPSPVEGVERALEEARKDGPNAPDSLSGRVKNDAPVKKVEPVSSREAESQGASGRRLIRTTAEWEKHTKGFGSRILKVGGKGIHATDDVGECEIHLLPSVEHCPVL